MKQMIKNEKMTVEQIITPDQQLQYIEVPFEMLENTLAVSVTYAVLNDAMENCVVDLGMKDPFRVRGWSGGARNQVSIGIRTATPGYLAGNLHQGTWAVILGAYKIPEKGCKVEMTIEFERESRTTWLKGDLHMHSIHSDGAYTLPETTAIAIYKGLDFIALTDHNTASQNYASEEAGDLIQIPGMELTTYRGHCNFYGVSDPVRDFRATTNAEVGDKVKEAKTSGAKVSINHPHDLNCPWEWDWPADVDWVEVWNGPWRPGNAETLDWWHRQLVAGKKITAIGGSDTHRPDRYVRHGMPTTWVKSSSRSATGILAGIERGNVFLSYSPEGPMIDLHCGEWTIGDTVTDNSQPIDIMVNRLEQGDMVKIVSNKGIERSYTISGSDPVFIDQFPGGDQLFLRIEVWRYFPEVDVPLMAALSNPLYFRIEGN